MENPDPFPTRQPETGDVAFNSTLWEKNPLLYLLFLPCPPFFSLVGASLPRFPYVCRARQKTSGRKENMYKHLTRECALTHSILIERFLIRRNEARSARYSFIIQTDAPLSPLSGFIVQSIIRAGNRKWPEWVLWVGRMLLQLYSPDVAVRPTMAGHFDCCQILL
jgi:hypothetical protein